MRCSIDETSCKPPSAVCTIEIASWAFFAATVLLVICDCSFSEIPRPAASSLALLMRRPEDRRWTEVVRLACEVLRLRCATSDALLVLITDAMKYSYRVEVRWLPDCFSVHLLT